MEFEVTPEQAFEIDAQQRILKPDYYDFECEHLEDKTSEKGNPMVLVRAKGIAGDAKGVVIFVNVLPQFARIFIRFREAMGGKFNPRATETQRFKFNNE